jgi:hypothetical protein
MEVARAVVEMAAAMGEEGRAVGLVGTEADLPCAQI